MADSVARVPDPERLEFHKWLRDVGDKLDADNLQWRAGEQVEAATRITQFKQQAQALQEFYRDNDQLNDQVGVADQIVEELEKKLVLLGTDIVSRLDRGGDPANDPPENVTLLTDINQPVDLQGVANAPNNRINECQLSFAGSSGHPAPDLNAVQQPLQQQIADNRNAINNAVARQNQLAKDLQADYERRLNAVEAGASDKLEVEMDGERDKEATDPNPKVGYRLLDRSEPWRPDLVSLFAKLFDALLALGAYALNEPIKALYYTGIGSVVMSGAATFATLRLIFKGTYKAITGDFKGARAVLGEAMEDIKRGAAITNGVVNYLCPSRSQFLQKTYDHVDQAPAAGGGPRKPAVKPAPPGGPNPYENPLSNPAVANNVDNEADQQLRDQAAQGAQQARLAALEQQRRQNAQGGLVVGAPVDEHLEGVIQADQVLPNAAPVQINAAPVQINAAPVQIPAGGVIPGPQQAANNIAVDARQRAQQAQEEQRLQQEQQAQQAQQAQQLRLEDIQRMAGQDGGGEPRV